VFFWTGFPTTFAHSLLAQAALRALPEPTTPLLVAFAVASLMLMLGCLSGEIPASDQQLD
jgi:hypothetical protein